MMKKKLFALSCAVLMTMSLAACGSPAGTPSSEGSADENNKVEPGIWKLEKVAKILDVSVEQLIEKTIS